MLGLGQRIFPLFALALEMEESFFDDKVSIASAQ
jgi:isopenicillin N synthase-like dioxygenase